MSVLVVRVVVRQKKLSIVYQNCFYLIWGLVIAGFKPGWPRSSRPDPGRPGRSTGFFGGRPDSSSIWSFIGGTISKSGKKRFFLKNPIFSILHAKLRLGWFPNPSSTKIMKNSKKKFFLEIFEFFIGSPLCKSSFQSSPVDRRNSPVDRSGRPDRSNPFRLDRGHPA